VKRPIIVRPYDPQHDAEELFACIVEHQNVHRRLEPSWPEGRAIVDEYVAYLEQQCALYDGRIMIAEQYKAMSGNANREVIGFVCVVASAKGDAPDDPEPFAWIQDIFVRPAHQRRGVATRLMAEAESFAKHRGACRVRLGVLDRNEGARALYRELGFRGYVRVLTKPLD
jgi:ribosomal protein S18 acetylase RimI-like enzyme